MGSLIIDCECASGIRYVVDNLVVLGHVYWSNISGLQLNHIVERHIFNALIFFKFLDD